MGQCWLIQSRTGAVHPLVDFLRFLSYIADLSEIIVAQLVQTVSGKYKNIPEIFVHTFHIYFKTVLVPLELFPSVNYSVCSAYKQRFAIFPECKRAV